MNLTGKYILALDQGTTSSRSMLFDENFKMTATSQEEFKQWYPNKGWVEHDPEVIWNSQLGTIKSVIQKAGVKLDSISGIGITNQRETTVVWNKSTGKPIYNAIVWQDRRTKEFCAKLVDDGHAAFVQRKTGLLLDAYFSASKINWILTHVEGARALAEQGELLFGTIDTWLIWKLTNGKNHLTDVTNASRTLLFDIEKFEWNEELLNLFDIPRNMMPEVVNCAGNFAQTEGSILGASLPIVGIMGDQQAALFGQMCVNKGMVKTTYGTGCFLMLNTGERIVQSTHKMISTIGWKIDDEVNYALEGSVFVGGAVIQWLRDEMEFFVEASHSESLAEAAEDNGGVYFVPALTGLGAPHWDADATGAIFGISRSTTKAHLTRAALESICFQVNDVIEAMSQDVDFEISEVRVDGGAAANSLLIQFQSDISAVNVIRPIELETTALGVAFMASIGMEQNTVASLQKKWEMEKNFSPRMISVTRSKMKLQWTEAVKRSLNWYS